MKVALISTVLFCVGVVSPCFANDTTTGTGNELINACNTENYKAQNIMWGVCLGYIEGVSNELAALSYQLAQIPNNKLTPDTNAYLTKISKVLINAVCLPPNSTREQAGLVVSKYLMDHPENLNWGSANLVVEAESAAWPCSK